MPDEDQLSLRQADEIRTDYSLDGHIITTTTGATRTATEHTKGLSEYSIMLRTDIPEDQEL